MPNSWEIAATLWLSGVNQVERRLNLIVVGHTDNADEFGLLYKRCDGELESRCVKWLCNAELLQARQGGAAELGDVRLDVTLTVLGICEQIAVGAVQVRTG